MGLEEAHPMAGKTSGTTAQQWRDRLRRWRDSGQSVREFCWHEGVSEPSFYQWRKRLKRDRGRAANVAVFLPVEVVDSPGSAGRSAGSASPAGMLVEVALPGGVTVRAGAHVDESQWRSVLRAAVAETRGC
jgi:transposase